MGQTHAHKIAGVAGLVFAALSLIVIPLTLAPESHGVASTSSTVLGPSARWYQEHRTGFLVGNYLGLAAFFPGFVQLAVLYAAIRKREGEAGWLGSLVFGCGAFAYAIFGCSLVTFQAMPFLIDPAVPQATRALSTLSMIWFALDGLAAAPFVAAVAWATGTTRVLPKWFAVFSWIITALAVLMSVGALVESPRWLAAGGTITDVGFVAFFLWISVMAVLFLRMNPRARARAE
jgi:hypothetical protein